MLRIDYRDIDELEPRRLAGEQIYFTGKEIGDAATEPVTARVLGFPRRYDDMYIAYAYIVGDIAYKFGWEMPGDQMHRAYSGPKAKWYDAVKQGALIAVRIDPVDPRRHVIVDARCAPMNQGVYFFGTQSTASKRDCP